MQGLCYRPSHGGFPDQAIPEEVFGGLVCVAVGWPAFVMRRVSAGDQPTSVSLPVWRGHFLKCSQSSGVVWLHGQRVCSSRTWMCLQARHLATLVRKGSCSLTRWMRRFWRWAGTFAGRSAEC